jgi:hypothetical protein
MRLEETDSIMNNNQFIIHVLHDLKSYYEL